MKKIVIRNLVCGILVFCSGLIALFGLLAPLTAVGTGTAMVTWDHGFDLMGMKSPYIFDGLQETNDSVDSLVIAIGSMSILQCLAAVALMALGVLSVFFPGVRKIAVWLCLVAVALTIVYMALGVAYTARFCKESGADADDMSRAAWVRTFAYIPMIFSVLTFIAAAVCNAFVSERALGDVRGAVGGVSGADGGGRSAFEQEKTRYARIAAYFSLKETGVLSEEEFAAQKKRLLPPL